MATLAERLTLAIRRREHSVAGLVLALNDAGVSITRAYVYQLMRGQQTNPTLGVVHALAGQLQVSVGWLVGEDEIESGSLSDLRQRAAVVGRALADLSDASLEQVHGIVELARRAEGLPPKQTVLPLPPPGPRLSERQRAVLAGRLCELREGAGKTVEQVERILQDEIMLGPIEQGDALIAPAAVERLLTVYGIDDNYQRDCVMTLARGEREPGQFDDPRVPLWLTASVNLEQQAVQLRSYNVQYVPPLLQTEEYARAAVSTAGLVPRGHEVIEGATQLVMARQELLGRLDGPTLWAVIDEVALMRPIGSREIQLRQLDALIQHAKQPNVTLQVLPVGAAVFVPRIGPFTILRFPEPFRTEVACLHAAESDVLIADLPGVESYKVTFEQLAVTTMDYTVGYLQKLRTDLAESLD